MPTPGLNSFLQQIDKATTRLTVMGQNIKGALPDATEQAAKILAEEVERRAPRGATGKLAGSVGYAPVPAKDGVGIAKVFVKEFYAWFHEYGTRKMGARPFFRPGIDAGMDRAVQAMSQEIKKRDGV